jgi:type II secretory pathway component PulJ
MVMPRAADNPRAAGRAGLTLLELVLALTLTSALAGAVMGFYHQAASLRESLLDEADFVAAERALMDRMTGELRAARAHDNAGIALEGGEMELRFVTAALPGRAAWAVPRATEEPPPAEQELRLVGFRLCEGEDETGEPRICGLERTVQKRLTAQVAEEGGEIEVTLLTDRVRFLRLRYWDGAAWITAWSGGDLPQAVEVTVGRRPLPPETGPEDYPYETFTRLIDVPAAAKARRGTVIRGLGEEGRP